ncbi:MAG: DUF4174 domain-containing protein [Hyphomonadaceae bacterium]|nr:DUF4174 domain-containing protein [Hyphomonadaceae bacterium]
MRRWIGVFGIMLTTLVSAPTSHSQGVGLAEGVDPLLNAQWTYRLVVVCTSVAGSGDPPLLSAQYEQAFEDWPGYIDRDLILVWLDQDYVMSWWPVANDNKDASLLIRGSETDESDLRGRTGCGSDREFVALIGKDGEVKARSETAISNQDLFARIDSMPMRQREMRAPN